ncbi:MAG: nucleoside recognition protein [Candidatus Zixiibacteriota bacterium]|nr:MAG: nucleoside recognition protein [candidate division Zixibacteria bacterium]
MADFAYKNSYQPLYRSTDESDTARKLLMEFILQTAFGLLKLMALIFIIIVPLIIILELFRSYGVLEKLTKLISPLTSRLGFEKDSVFPLLAGIVFGISYGGGVLVSEAKKGRIVGNQAFLVALFLALCHAIFEDTLIFIAQGAIWWIVVLTRVATAFMITALVAIWLKKQGHP